MTEWKNTSISDRQGYIMERFTDEVTKETLEGEEINKIFRYSAFRQSSEGWETRQQRLLCVQESPDLIRHYMSLHYPNAICVGYWPLDFHEEMMVEQS